MKGGDAKTINDDLNLEARADGSGERLVSSRRAHANKHLKKSIERFDDKLKNVKYNFHRKLAQKSKHKLMSNIHASTNLRDEADPYSRTVRKSRSCARRRDFAKVIEGGVRTSLPVLGPPAPDGGPIELNEDSSI